MLAPITSKKHFVQQGIDSIMGGTIKNNSIVVGVQAPATASNQVFEGSVVKAVFVEYWLLAGGQQPGSITLTVMKRIGDSPHMTFAESAQLHTYTNKKNILYTTQGITPDANGNPIPFIRMWIKIPKGKQRFGLGDQLVVNISANVEDCTICGTAIYKEYQ